MSESGAKRVIKLLYDSGTRKITFAGGEPTVISFLPNLIKYASNLGMTTVLITNGYRITQDYIDLMDNKLNWVGLSIDSGINEINYQLGRGPSGHVERTLRVAKLLKDNNIIIKINTVVTSLTWQEDMNWLLEETKPKRWKVFQMLPITGENDNASDLLVTPDQFTHFINNHKKSNPTPERNDDMKGGYVMIDPEGRFFNNDTGVMTHGPSILDVGVEKAFEFSNFSYDTFLGRNGIYDWT